MLYEKIPNKPYCTNDFSAGLKIRNKSDAIKYKHIQINSPGLIRYMIFDLDYENSAFACSDNNLPIPNWVAVNPTNAHSHIVYELEFPVCISLNAHKKPLSYYKAIYYTYRKILRCDPAFNGLLTKNPLYDKHWKVIMYNRLYGLSELAEYVELKNEKEKNIIEHDDCGRNCTIFNKLREHAYDVLRKANSKPDLDEWLDNCFNVASSINCQLVTPLKGNEVKHIAKSVAKFTHKNFEKNKNNFSQKQAARGKKSKGGGRPRGAQKWLELGISKATYYRRKANGFYE